MHSLTLINPYLSISISLRPPKKAYFYVILSLLRTCKDNKDKTFADCSIPQEKTNAEINAELEISDDSSEEDLYTEKRLTSVSDFKPPGHLIYHRISTVIVTFVIVCHK